MIIPVPEIGESSLPLAMQRMFIVAPRVKLFIFSKSGAGSGGAGVGITGITSNVFATTIAFALTTTFFACPEPVEGATVVVVAGFSVSATVGVDVTTVIG